MIRFDPTHSGWRRAIAGVAFVPLLPVILVSLILKLVMLPFERPSHRSADEVARYLRSFIDGTGEEWAFDDFTSRRLADPRMESVRSRAELWDEKEDLSELLALLAEVESIAATDRASLIDLIRRALDTDDVSNEMIDRALPYPRSLGASDAKAYDALSHWADDDDIRARDAAYADRQRGQLGHQLARLSCDAGSQPA